MPSFKYAAYDRQGKPHKGSLIADTERQARRQLSERGLFTSTLKAQRESNSGGRGGSTGGGPGKKSSLFAALLTSRVSNFETALILRQLGVLIKSGLPLEDSLKLIVEQADSNKQRQLAETWRADLMEGRSLSVAMRRSRYQLPESIIAGVGVGEETGHLHDVLMRMADELETSAENRKALRRGLMYPVTLAIASIVAVAVMMVWVVPRITRVFISARAELPGVTKIVVAVSNFTQAYGGYIALALIATLVIAQLLLANRDRRRAWHKYMLSLPGIGNWMRMANLADWSRSLGTLLQSGVPALAALRIASSVMTNLHLQWQMEQVTERMRRGNSLHQAIRDEQAGTGFLLQMIGSGEASSELDTMLIRVADYYTARLKASVDTFLKLMNPTLIIGMGIIILIIVAAVMLPILKMNEIV